MLLFSLCTVDLCKFSPLDCKSIVHFFKSCSTVDMEHLVFSHNLIYSVKLCNKVQFVNSLVNALGNMNQHLVNSLINTLLSIVNLMHL